MKQDVTKLYHLDGTLRSTKQADYSYINLLKQGLSVLGINPANPGMVTTPNNNSIGYCAVFSQPFVLS